MYQCPGCGAQLRFDIKTQQMLCDNCRTQVDPYKVIKDHDAEETDYFEVTVFHCPQCGGEIMSTENSAAEFCSFCGASTILTGRIEKEKRPGFIIPFKKTKEDCKAAYRKALRGALYAPSEFRKTEFIDSFRGIYMPYWAYDIANEGHVVMKGETSYRKGDYIITEHYDLHCDVDAFYRGISYDASSSFDDNLSDCIAPYDVHEMMNFTPAFLSGFYADVDDVPSEIYQIDAEDISIKNTFRKVKGQFTGKTIKSDERVIRNITRQRAVDRTMYPVWFMSYRNNDRVAYAVVNGQTGRVTADVPVAIWKYLLGSIITAVPLFFLLNAFFTFIPNALLTLSCILAFIVEINFATRISKIRNREARLTDKGYLYKTGINSSMAVNLREQKKEKNSMNPLPGYIAVAVGLVVAANISNIYEYDLYIFGIMLVISLVIVITCVKNQKETSGKNGFPAHVLLLVVMAAAALIKFLKPVSDIYYYMGVILVLVGVAIANLTVIKKHNILTTRPLPQFERKGGDDRA